MLFHARLGGALAIAALFADPTAAQDPTTSIPALDLEHAPPPCLDTEAFPLLVARAPSSEVARFTRDLAVRFKAEADTDYYEIELSDPDGAEFRAVIPKPLPEASRVLYYFVSGDPELQTEQYIVNVLTGGCPGAVAAPASLASDIRVRRTSDAQSTIPSFFAADGIQVSGGISGATIGVVAAAAGGAALTAVVVGGEGTAPPTAIPPPIIPPEALRACFTPDPIPDITSGGTLLFDAGCSSPATVTSFTWDFGDGSAGGSGSSVEHLFTPGGTYSVRLTVSDGQRMDTTSRLIRVLATPSSCFVTSPDPPRIPTTESIQFNGECSVGDRDGGTAAITRYAWDFGDGRPGAEGVFVSRQFDPDVYGVTLTVTNSDGRQASKTQFVVVEAGSSTARTLEQRSARISFTGHLQLPEESASSVARVTLGESRVVTLSNRVPQTIEMRAQGGTALIVAQLPKSNPPGRLVFDFGSAPRFEAGSLRVESGQVLALTERRLVFRVTEDSGSPIRFRFAIERPVR